MLQEVIEGVLKIEPSKLIDLGRSNTHENKGRVFEWVREENGEEYEIVCSPEFALDPQKSFEVYTGAIYRKPGDTLPRPIVIVGTSVFGSFQALKVYVFHGASHMGDMIKDMIKLSDL